LTLQLSTVAQYISFLTWNIFKLTMILYKWICDSIFPLKHSLLKGNEYVKYVMKTKKSVWHVSKKYPKFKIISCNWWHVRKVFMECPKSVRRMCWRVRHGYRFVSMLQIHDIILTKFSRNRKRFNIWKERVNSWTLLLLERGTMWADIYGCLIRMKNIYLTRKCNEFNRILMCVCICICMYLCMHMH